MYISEESNATIRNSIFRGGRAVSGGAIALQSGSSLSISSNCTFYKNDASVSGSDIYANRFKSLSIRDS